MMPVDALSPGKSQTASSPLPKKSLYTHLFLFFFFTNFQKLSVCLEIQTPE